MMEKQTFLDALKEHTHRIRAHQRNAGVKMRADEELDAEIEAKCRALRLDSLSACFLAE